MYKRFNPNEISAKGWLYDQLLLQANGLSGNLDKIWLDVKDSAWIGGNKEGWERVPYWLDGFIPLAYLLKSEDMISRAEKYIQAILKGQQEDGWICPCAKEARPLYDIWALFLIGKVLALYCEFTDSDEAKEALYRAMKNGYELISDGSIKLFEWGKSRWFEAMIPLKYLYDIKPENWILDFAKELRKQGTDYSSLTELWKRPLNKWTQETHIVNLCMMFKYEAVTVALTGEKYEDKAEELWRLLYKYNGTAVGCFTGDECLSGTANNQGTELCSVVELMYCCELLYEATGEDKWAKRLERLAYNALPATISDDMWTHQYDQQVNQIACVTFPGRQIFRTNGTEAHLFGLEPNFGCCTANFNQGWPKLVMNAFMKTNKGVICPVIMPAELNTRIDGNNVKINVITEYPFRFSAKYVVETKKETEFELKIRIPDWAKNLKVNGKTVGKKSFVAINKKWNGREEICIEFEDVPHLINRPLGLKAAEYGPLVFSLPIETEYVKKEYERDGVERKFPYCDYELYPKSEWRYGFVSNEFTVVHKKGDEIPFSSKNPRIVLKAKCCKVKWDYEDGFDTVSAKKPSSKKPLSNPETKELYPYGCAKLRITETYLLK